MNIRRWKREKFLIRADWAENGGTSVIAHVIHLSLLKSLIDLFLSLKWVQEEKNNNCGSRALNYPNTRSPGSVFTVDVVDLHMNNNDSVVQITTVVGYQANSSKSISLGLWFTQGLFIAGRCHCYVGMDRE